MDTRKLALCVVLFIGYCISSSDVVRKRRRSVNKLSKFQSKSGPIGPPRTNVQHEIDDDEDYYEYYDDSESIANNTEKSLTVEEVARKRTARPPGFGPPQTTSTNHPLEGGVTRSLTTDTTLGVVSSSPEIQPSQARQTVTQFVPATTFPRIPIRSHEDASTSIPAPPITHPPSDERPFYGPLYFVQPGQPFQVGRNVIIHSGKEISSLRGKFANLPSLLPNDVFVSRIQVPAPLPSANPPSSQPHFETIGRSESFPTLKPVTVEQTLRPTKALNGVEHEQFILKKPPSPINTALQNHFTEQPQRQVTNITAIASNQGQSFFLNHRDAFQVVTVPTNEFRISEETTTPHRLFSITTSVRITKIPLDEEHLTIETTTVVPSLAQSSERTLLNITRTNLDNFTTTSQASHMDEKIIPNGVLSFTDADIDQTFRVGHNFVRIKLFPDETTTPFPTTSKHTKQPLKNTIPLSLPMFKRIELPETSEFSESPFSYYGENPQEYASAPVQGEHLQKSTIETGNVKSGKEGRHKDRGTKHSRIRPNLAHTSETVRNYQAQPPATRPSGSVANHLPSHTKPQVEVPPEPVEMIESSKLLPEKRVIPPEQSPAFVVGSPSVYTEPDTTEHQPKPRTNTSLYGEPPVLEFEDKLGSNNAFVEEHQTFRIDVSRMRKILDEYLPKSAPSLGASNTVTEGFTQKAFSENQRNKLIDKIITAIESVQKFSESVRREMRQVLRDSFVPNLPNERFPNSSLRRSALTSPRKMISSKYVESDSTSGASSFQSHNNNKETRQSQKAVSRHDNSLLLVPTGTASTMRNEPLKINNGGVLLPWRRYRNISATARFIPSNQLRALRH